MAHIIDTESHIDIKLHPAFQAIEKIIAESTTYHINPWAAIPSGAVAINGMDESLPTPVWRSIGDGIIPGQVHYVGGEKLICSAGKVPKPDESSDWRQYL